MSRLFELCFRCIATASFVTSAQAQSAPIAEDAVSRQLRAATFEAERGEISAALSDVKAAIVLDPNRSDAWYELGSVLGQTGDFDEAEAALRKSIQLKPDLAKTHYGLALALIGNPQGKMDWTGAISECREALKYQPDFPQALNLLGAGLTATGQSEAAIPVLDHAIQLAPELADAHFNLGLALEGKDRLEQATREYRAAIQAKTTYPEAESALGSLLFRLGRTAEAERALDEALRQNPDLTGAHYTLARLLRSLNRNSEAAVEFAESKDLTGRPANGIQSSQLSNQALELAAKGDLATAAALLHKAIALKPDYGVPHYNLGLILADSGDNAGAIHELEKAVSLLPGQAKPWFDLGRVLTRAHDDQGALDAIAWAAKLSPADSAIRSELASLQSAGPLRRGAALQVQAATQPRVGAASDTAMDHRSFALELKSHGDCQGAAGELLRSLALQPAAIESRRSLAESYVCTGENERGILEYYKVLCTVPEDVASRIALGKILLLQGNPGEAMRQLRLALHYRPDSSEARAAIDEAEKVFSKH